MKKKLVTIIIPVYNVKNYLKQCVLSVINQTYKNLEIILIDDGSTDGSGVICDSFKSLDDRIKVIHKSNTGLGLTRNTGIEIAHGDYICFIDSDDFISNNMVDQLMTCMVNFKADTVIGGYTRVSENGKKLYSKKYVSEEYQAPDVKLKLLPRLIGSSPYKKDSIKMSVWNVMFSMKVISENNIRFVSERQYVSEDIIWDMDYYNHAKKVKILNSDSYFYRARGNSLTRQFNYEDRLLDIKKLYLFEKDKLYDLKIFEIASKRLSREFFINLAACIDQIVETNNIINSIKIVSKILNDEFIQNIVLSYPYRKASLKASVFLRLIAKKRALLMVILLQIL